MDVASVFLHKTCAQVDIPLDVWGELFEDPPPVIVAVVNGDSCSKIAPSCRGYGVEGTVGSCEQLQC